MDYLNNLNEKQRKAAKHTEGPLLILAGAGSGKTSTMTRRIAYMIREQGISPYQILAVTFTNKAAREMRDRVESLVGTGLNMWITTFHSACLRILRMNADRLGYTKDFTIYDPVDQKAVIKAAVKAENADDKIFTPNYVLGIISDAKEHGIDSREFAENADGYKEKITAKLYRDYEETLKKNNAMDFDDLIWRTVQLFEKDAEVLDYYREKFRYIMVDEYQDTNYMQYRIIRLLAEKHRNICVVGDDDQCIYQWRGADIRNILSFEKDFPGTEVVKLEQNYRSCGNILKAAHSVIRHNRGRKDKQLWTEAEDGNRIMYRRLDNEKAEACVCRTGDRPADDRREKVFGFCGTLSYQCPVESFRRRIYGGRCAVSGAGRYEVLRPKRDQRHDGLSASGSESRGRSGFRADHQRTEAKRGGKDAGKARRFWLSNVRPVSLSF